MVFKDMQVGDNGFYRLNLPPPGFEMPVGSLEDRKKDSLTGVA